MCQHDIHIRTVCPLPKAAVLACGNWIQPEIAIAICLYDGEDVSDMGPTPT